MPRLIPFRLAAACALALILSLSLTAGAVAKGVPADLRVVGKGGKILTEQMLSTSTTTIKTSKQANCFGAGNAGSGKSVTVKGATAMGLLGQAAKSTGSLRPLLITDAFDFGLGICGIGGNVVSGKASWYLKVNHKGATVGGDAVKLKPGDEVLWSYASSFPYPNELALEAPDSALGGMPFEVQVFSYDEKGKRKPVAGATVTGASGPTGADGKATVTLTAPAALQATHGKDIPSPCRRSAWASSARPASEVSRRRGTAVATALLLAALATAGCGLGAGAGVGTVELTVTRDFGAVPVLQRSPEADESDTVMRVLEGSAEISTRYGGGFVQSIDGVEEAERDGHPHDWFFYVNGVESPIGAADYALRRRRADLVGLPRLARRPTACRPWSAPGPRPSSTATKASATRWRSSARAGEGPARGFARRCAGPESRSRPARRRARSGSSSAPGRGCAPTRRRRRSRTARPTAASSPTSSGGRAATPWSASTRAARRAASSAPAPAWSRRRGATKRRRSGW